MKKLERKIWTAANNMGRAQRSFEGGEGGQPTGKWRGKDDHSIQAESVPCWSRKHERIYNLVRVICNHVV